MAATSAVVLIKDIQYRVHEDEVVEVPLLADEVGAHVEFDQVLMVSGDEVQVGTPTVEGAKVTAEVLGHGRSEKIVQHHPHPIDPGLTPPQEQRPWHTRRPAGPAATDATAIPRCWA
jgi:ribosomal protein L21